MRAARNTRTVSMSPRHQVRGSTSSWKKLENFVGCQRSVSVGVQIRRLVPTVSDGIWTSLVTRCRLVVDLL